MLYSHLDHHHKRFISVLCVEIQLRSNKLVKGREYTRVKIPTARDGKNFLQVYYIFTVLWRNISDNLSL